MAHPHVPSPAAVLVYIRFLPACLLACLPLPAMPKFHCEDCDVEVDYDAGDCPVCTGDMVPLALWKAQQKAKTKAEAKAKAKTKAKAKAVAKTKAKVKDKVKKDPKGKDKGQDKDKDKGDTAEA